MSKQSTSGIPEAPKASRRALLMGLAAAATPLAPVVANALGGLADVDPIFDVIAEHETAVGEYTQAVLVSGGHDCLWTEQRCRI
jgi:hypothetical protein